MTTRSPVLSLGRVRYRVAQAIAYARPGQPPDLPAEILALLRAGTVARLRNLDVRDQHHLIAVGRALVDRAAPAEVIIAGVLHDIGKVYAGHRVGFVDRGLKVMLKRVAPGTLARLARLPAPPAIGRGIWIAANHARLGAEIATRLGYGERICWLIAHHEDALVDDPGLALLRAADEARSSVPGHRSTRRKEECP